MPHKHSCEETPVIGRADWTIGHSTYRSGIFKSLENSRIAAAVARLAGFRRNEYACAMPMIVKWIVLMLVAIVALSPLGEIFDRTDEWSQDGSDLVLYVISLFCFAGISMMRRGDAVITRVTSSRALLLQRNQQPSPELKQGHRCSDERALFLAFCDLRI
jgi:hypothetical protein